MIKHYCTSHLEEGEWIVWKCPFCSEYERRLNIKTDQMITKGKTEYLHVGSFDYMKTNNVTEPLIKNISLN